MSEPSDDFSYRKQNPNGTFDKPLTVSLDVAWNNVWWYCGRLSYDVNSSSTTTHKHMLTLLYRYKVKSAMVVAILLVSIISWP